MQLSLILREEVLVTVMGTPSTEGGEVKVTAGRGQWFLSHAQGFDHFARSPEGACPFLLAALCSCMCNLDPAVCGRVEICSCSRAMANQIKRALANADSSSRNRMFSGGEVEQCCHGPSGFVNLLFSISACLDWA